jgi:hypothetical protein
MGKYKVLFLALIFSLCFSLVCFASPVSTVKSMKNHIGYTFIMNDGSIAGVSGEITWGFDDDVVGGYYNSTQSAIYFVDSHGLDTFVHDKQALWLDNGGNWDSSDSINNHGYMSFMSTSFTVSPWVNDSSVPLYANRSDLIAKVNPLFTPPQTPVEILDGIYGFNINSVVHGGLIQFRNSDASLFGPFLLPSNGHDGTFSCNLDGSFIDMKIAKNPYLISTINGSWQVNLSHITDEVEHTMVCTYVEDGKITTTMYKLQRVIGTIDANGDGVDDRTGEITSNPNVTNNTGVLNPPKRQDYSSGILGDISFGLDTVLFYVTAPFVWLGNVIKSLMDIINNGFTWVSDFNKFLASLFSFLPIQAIGLIELAITASVVGLLLRTFGRK